MSFLSRASSYTGDTCSRRLGGACRCCYTVAHLRGRPTPWYCFAPLGCRSHLSVRALQSRGGGGLPVACTEPGFRPGSTAAGFRPGSTAAGFRPGCCSVSAALAGVVNPRGGSASQLCNTPSSSSLLLHSCWPMRKQRTHAHTTQLSLWCPPGRDSRPAGRHQQLDERRTWWLARRARTDRSRPVALQSQGEEGVNGV